MSDFLIGVLALQGDFREHIHIVKSIGEKAIAVKTKEELAIVDGLIIPGGESTTVGKLLDRFGLMDVVRAFPMENKPIYGTCTGMILLAKDIEDSNQFKIGLLDITVKRNAYGRQIDSFESPIFIKKITTIDRPHNSIFIRAPFITRIGENVEVMSELDGNIIMVREGLLLASSFHPELTDDCRIHKYFLDMVKEYRG